MANTVTTTHRSAFASSAAVTFYAYPPPHLPTARVIAVNAAITGACAAASSDNITVKGYASSAYSTTIASGAVSAAGSYQHVPFTITQANAAAVRQTQATTGGLKITLPDCGAITNPVTISITWQGDAPTSTV